jgi:hypothetical protein
MTIAVIKTAGHRYGKDPYAYVEDDINVDLSDYGCVYIGQGDEWIEIPNNKIQDLIKALEGITP